MNKKPNDKVENKKKQNHHLLNKNNKKQVITGAGKREAFRGLN